MATVSTVPAVMEALYQAFAASSELTGVQVSESWPGGDGLRDKALFLGNVRSTDIHIPVSRAVRVVREELYSVDVHAQAAFAGTNAKAARESCFAMYAAVEDVIANNPTLGVNGLIKAVPHAYELQTGLTDSGGWIAFLRIEIEVQARLQ